MTPETLATLRRRLSRAKAAVKTAQERYDRAERFRAQNEAFTRLHDARYRADDLERQVKAAERALEVKP